jgi:hypothetical protein
LTHVLPYQRGCQGICTISNNNKFPFLGKPLSARRKNTQDCEDWNDLDFQLLMLSAGLSQVGDGLVCDLG